MNLKCIGRIAAIAIIIVATAMASGCDMGTYENRLNETRSEAPVDNS